MQETEKFNRVDLGSIFRTPRATPATEKDGYTYVSGFRDLRSSVFDLRSSIFDLRERATNLDFDLAAMSGKGTQVVHN